MRLKAIKIDNNIWKLNEITMVKLDSCLYKSEKYNSKIVSNKQYKISEVMFNFDNNRLYNISITNKIEDSAKDIIFIDNKDNEISTLTLYNLFGMCGIGNDSEMESPYDNIICEPSKLVLGLFVRLRLKEE